MMLDELDNLLLDNVKDKKPKTTQDLPIAVNSSATPEETNSPPKATELLFGLKIRAYPMRDGRIQIHCDRVFPMGEARAIATAKKGQRKKKMATKVKITGEEETL